MLDAKVVETIEADIDDVWPVISDFRCVEPGPGIEAVEYKGDGVGMTRHIKTANGTVVERLDLLDNDNHVFSYSIINDDHPLPFTDYSSRVMLQGEDGSTTVSWVGTFNSRGIEDDKAIGLACSIYNNLINRARNLLDH